MTELSESLKLNLMVQKHWLIYRGENNLYLPSDPRFKGVDHWLEHNEARERATVFLQAAAAGTTRFDWLVVDPPHPDPSVGFAFFRFEYERKILLRKCGVPMTYGWPDPQCRLIGHVRAKEEGPVRFTCINCWKLYDCDPSSYSAIVGEPDEAWIAEHFDKARRAIESAPA